MVSPLSIRYHFRRRRRRVFRVHLHPLHYPAWAGPARRSRQEAERNPGEDNRQDHSDHRKQGHSQDQEKARQKQQDQAQLHIYQSLHETLAEHTFTSRYVFGVGYSHTYTVTLNFNSGRDAGNTYFAKGKRSKVCDRTNPRRPKRARAG